MKVGIDIKPSERALRKIAKELGPKELRRVERRAVSRAIQAANTEMSRQIRQTVNLKASTIKEVTKVSRPRGLDSTGKIVVKERGVPLAEYGGRFGKKGLTVRVKKGGSRGRVESAFAVDTRAGKQRAFERVSDARYPLQMLFGPSVLTQAEKALPAVRKRSLEILERRLIAELDRAVKRARG